MKPLAERLRPENLDQFIGQEHLVGNDGIIRKMIDSNQIHSMILWGPPGTGKTTLARLIAKLTGRQFYSLNAIDSGVKQVREVIEQAKKGKLWQQDAPILFIDEIHRFSKSQQDALLKAVEQGTVILIGATTENPSFSVISPLLSRCQVYTLNRLTKKDLEKILHRALHEDKTLAEKQIKVEQTSELFLQSAGDARKLLNILEMIVNLTPNGTIIVNNENVRKVLQTNTNYYDKNGDWHYDIISAFIKSIRGSDPDAAIYWLARMLDAGEDIKFIARRLIISAAEDIGLANPNALLLAQATYDAVSQIGLPEARIILAQTTIYLASSPKSNSAYKAINKALETVKKTGPLQVPLHLRNAPTELMKELNYGSDYKYPHDYPNNFVEQEYLPPELKNTKFYSPGNNQQEKKLLERLKIWWKDRFGNK